MIITRPTVEQKHYYQKYIDAAQGENLIEALIIYKNRTAELIKRVNDELAGYRYAPEKWSIKQVLQHIIDCERVFDYRAMRMARRDPTPLQSFYENEYAANDHTERLSVCQIEDEFLSVRDGSISLFKNVNPDVLDFEGTASDMKFTPRLIGWVIVGHNAHHLKVIEEKYLNN